MGTRRFPRNLQKMFQKILKQQIEHLQVYSFIFLKGLLFLNTSVVSASFILSGKLAVDNISLKKF